MSDEHWVLRYEGLDPKQEGLREALCTLGNGVFATRGAAEEQHAGAVSYPGTYIGGVYNQLSSEVAGHTVVNEDLVNAPNWLWLTFRPVDGAWLDLWNADVRDYTQELDLRTGTLTRSFRLRAADGRLTRVVSRRLVHMGKPNLAALSWELTPENWSGEAIVRTGIDGSVTNTGVARYRQLSAKHLERITRSAVAPEGVYLRARHYAGLELKSDRVVFAPDMPGRIERLHFRFEHHRRWYDVELTRHRLRVAVDDAEPDAVVVEGPGHRHQLAPGGSIEHEVSARMRSRASVAGGGKRRVDVDEQRLAGEPR